MSVVLLSSERDMSGVCFFYIPFIPIARSLASPDGGNSFFSVRVLVFRFGSTSFDVNTQTHACSLAVDFSLKEMGRVVARTMFTGSCENL